MLCPSAAQVCIHGFRINRESKWPYGEPQCQRETHSLCLRMIPSLALHFGTLTEDLNMSEWEGLQSFRGSKPKDFGRSFWRFEVAVFRLSRGLEGPDSVEAWLRSRGFSGEGSLALTVSSVGLGVKSSAKCSVKGREVRAV